MVVTITGINNTGPQGATAHAYPEFEIYNTGSSSITKVTITYGSNSLIWEGTLTVSSTLVIKQLPMLRPTVSDIESGYLYGDKIVLASNVTGQSISFTKVGGSTMTCRVRVIPRYDFSQ
jgi:hypothetical protein